MPRGWPISFARSRRLIAASVLILAALVLSGRSDGDNAGGVWTQQGPKLVGTGAGQFSQGYSVALSADGSPS
jgi:hypothetical protein